MCITTALFKYIMFCQFALNHIQNQCNILKEPTFHVICQSFYNTVYDNVVQLLRSGTPLFQILKGLISANYH